MQDAAFGIIPIFQQTPEPLFLLIQQNSGAWGFPKGHPEAGETPIVSACREFEEETGILDYQIIHGRTFSERYNFQEKQRPIEKNVTYFIGIVKTQVVKIQLQELKSYAWLNFQAAMKQFTYESRKQLLIQAEAYYRLHYRELEQ